MKLALLTTLLLISQLLIAGPIEDALLALDNGDITGARKYFEQALSTDRRDEACMYLAFLNHIEMKDGDLETTYKVLSEMQDPSPYVYALFFTSNIAGNGGKRSKEILKQMQRLYELPKVNNSIRASLDYNIGTHYFMSNETALSQTHYNKIGALKQWQLTGTFDNTSGSGFNKNYPPVNSPKPDASFLSSNNAPVAWFTPAIESEDPWCIINNYLPAGQGIIYAQTFVQSPNDQEVVITLGGQGSLKLWVNDQVLIEEEEKLASELDVLARKVTLKAGYNRILVQLGHTYTEEHPNFLVRITDENYKLINNLKHTSEYQTYAKANAAFNSPAIEHFAEAYFRNMVKNNPDKPIYYLLLTETYNRKGYHSKMIETLQKGLEKFPENPLLRYYLVIVYNKIGDRTALVKELEVLKTNFEQSSFYASYNYSMQINQKNYKEAEKYLKQLEACLGKEHPVYLSRLINFYATKDEIEETILTIEKANRLHPENTEFFEFTYNVAMAQKASTYNAISMLEKFLKDKYNFGLTQQLINAYTKVSNTKKAEKLLNELLTKNPVDNVVINYAINTYFDKKEYEKAEALCLKALSLAPYDESIWTNLAYVYVAQKQDEKAKKAFEKVLLYNPNNFKSRDMLRELNGQKSLLDYFQTDDVELIIKKELQKGINSDENYEVVFYNSQLVVFPQGASTEHFSHAVRVMNEAGVNQWKETTIGYNPSSQSLIIEKAEAMKKNGQKIKAQRNGNDLVFPDLEPGDVLLIEYRFDNYAYGKLNSEIWSTFIFNDYVPTHQSSFKLLVPKGYKFDINEINLNTKPTMSVVDEFDCYTWDFKDIAKMKSEPFMPPLTESGMVLNISTVNNWKVIADWYSDVAMPMAQSEHNIDLVYNAIFKDKNYTTKTEKAAAIYNYIAENINYSSVPFMQSSYVPQKPMVTVSNKLGDCKDMSTLFFTLAEKAGLKSNLVLVSTLDNGENAMVLPSTNFDHCIIRVELDNNKVIYQELTDNKLPFGATPANLINAQALVIPRDANDNVGNELSRIPHNRIISNTLNRVSTYKVDNEDLKVTSNLSVSGFYASSYRHSFNGYTKDELNEEISYMYAENFDSKINILNYTLDDLDTRADSFKLNVDLKVEDGIVSIGSIKAIKPTFVEKIFSIRSFQETERQQAINYWRYEECEVYDHVIIVEIPEGSTLIEVPSNFALTNAFVDYKLEFAKLSDTKIKITRKVTTQTKTLPASSYADLKDAIRKIVKAEDIYISYK
jgi:tetratricopeptide (TPR) repeat protein